MKSLYSLTILVSAGTGLFLGLSTLAYTQTSAWIPDKGHKQMPTLMHAKGTFDVKMTPQPQGENIGDPSVGRMSIDKQFHGDLEASSKGEMLAVGTSVKDSAGYV